MNPPAVYAAARGAGLRPALLESLGPPTAFSRRALLAVAPRRRLEVWGGLLYEDGVAIGAADALLDELQTGLAPGRDFPVWVGFFSYEFAARLGLPANAAMPGLPEAAFCLYGDGWLWRDGRLVWEPHSPPGAALAGAATQSLAGTLGAEVAIIDRGQPPDDGSLAGASHVVLGPGPGDPASSGRLLDWVDAGLRRRLPLLGVCLGHQALGVALGARLERTARPVHGEAHAVRHDGGGLFAGLPDPALFTRYHSLHLCELPATLRRTAWTDDGLVMAVAHRELPAFGVQFHPESMLSAGGLDLLANFLRC